MSREHGDALRGLDRAQRNKEGRFGYMFKQAPAFEPPDGLLTELAGQMREPDGAGASLDSGIPAGFTFLGQFIDHDMTFDQTPLEEARKDPDATQNFRTPALDLDAVYGKGPDGSPELYEPGDRDKLRVTSAPHLDLPRSSGDQAVIGDPRNDENLVISQLHLGFLRFHNAAVDHVRARPGRQPKVFEEARRLTRWHYQWLVVNEFLPKVIGTSMLSSIIQPGPGKQPKIQIKHYKPGNPNRPMMPVEYAAAAYRFGHSMVRAGYKVNDTTGAAMFEATPSDTNLNGFRALPAPLVIDWANFFQVAGRPAPQSSRAIDARLVAPLFDLPVSVVPDNAQAPARIGSLPERNLIRGKRVGLPSGQKVAQAMGETALSNSDLGVSNDPGWGGEAPLWYYVLKESELLANGAHLGPVGGRIVGEVIVALIRSDRSSYLHASGDPGFQPEAPFAGASGGFTTADFLAFAGAL
jgi:hypothetical protein